jgi:hypothetical protein
MAGLVAVVGTVSTVKGQGFQLDERPGVWFNVSKYADPKPELPAVGQRVKLGVAGSGYVRALELPGSAEGGTGDTSSSGTTSPAPDVVTMRLEVLKAAASFLSTRPEAKSIDVLTVAEAWERWVTR